MEISAFIYISWLLNYQYWSVAFVSIFRYCCLQQQIHEIILTFRLLSRSVKININPFRLLKVNKIQFQSDKFQFYSDQFQNNKCMHSCATKSISIDIVNFIVICRMTRC